MYPPNLPRLSPPVGLREDEGRQVRLIRVGRLVTGSSRGRDTCGGSQCVDGLFDVFWELLGSEGLEGFSELEETSLEGFPV